MSRAPVSGAQQRPVRVLHVVSNMDRGGAETMLMNYYRRIDRSVLQFDFLAHADRPGQFDQEITGLGGRVLRVPSPGVLGIVTYVRAVRRLLKSEGPFRAIHTHNDSSGALACLAAMAAGVGIRVVHAHSTAPLRSTRRVAPALEEQAMRWLIASVATTKCACGTSAARYLFGQRVAATPGSWLLLPNALDLTEFALAWAEDRERVRTSLGVPKGIPAIGHIGSFKPVKNHEFLLKIAGQLRAQSVEFVLLLFGDGPLRAGLERQARAQGLERHVRFFGSRADIPSLLRALDVFLLPSHAEGLPVALLEAQAAGLPCLVSSAVTTEADIGLDLVRHLLLDGDPRPWAQACLDALNSPRPHSFELVRAGFVRRGLDASENTGLLCRLYGVECA